MNETRWALLSVSDKTGLLEFARRLTENGFALLATGGTQKALVEAKIPVTSVETFTGFPEGFGGRLKTLHPKIAGGILFRRDNADDCRDAEQLEIRPIDIVVVNLYPFEKMAVDPSSSAADVIEQIDIGGPTLLRAAAKNHAHVTAICDPADYGRVADELEKGEISPKLRSELATKVFARTAGYDSAITTTLSKGGTAGMLLRNGLELRYGENPHQWGKYYDVNNAPRRWTVLQEEKQMSYLNILDADGAWELVREFDDAAAACIKHANPSGVAVHKDITEAFQRSFDADRVSAFGVIIALNRSCPAAIVQKIIDQKIFAELIIAPDYEAGALKLLKEKPKIRVIKMQNGEILKQPLYRSALGGMLVQNHDEGKIDPKKLNCVTEVKPTNDQLRDFMFAWHVVKHAKSNAIVLAKDGVTVGIGAGQTSRVDATHIAARRAGERARGSVLASDAFFPFADSLDEAAKHGIAAVIQSGGSIRDEEVIAKANELKIPMVFTGVRAFRH